jgi:hypothetical protein
MTRPPILALIFSVIPAACSSAVSPSDGMGGSNGFGGAGMGGSEGGGLELCGISVTCTDGVLKGVYGTYCDTLTATCDLGCRVPSAGTYSNVDPHAFAQTLCNSPDAGAADASDASDRGDGGGD